MLHELGLGSYLEMEQFHKYGLTFLFQRKNIGRSGQLYLLQPTRAMRIPPMAVEPGQSFSH